METRPPSVSGQAVGWQFDGSELSYRLRGAASPHTRPESERVIPSVSEAIFNYTVSKFRSDRRPTPRKAIVRDTSPNGYHAITTCPMAANSSTPAIAPYTGLRPHHAPFFQGPRIHACHLLFINRLTNPTNATLVTGEDSALMLTPGIALFAGGNYFRTDATVPLGRWFRSGSSWGVLAGLNGGRRGEGGRGDDQAGINGDQTRYAEIAIGGAAGRGWRARQRLGRVCLRG